MLHWKDVASLSPSDLRVRGFSLDRMREVVGSQVIFQAVLRDRDSEVRNR